MKTIVLVSTRLGLPDRSELRRLEEADRYTRTSLFWDALSSDILDERFLGHVQIIRRFLYKSLPNSLSQLLEAFIIKGKYDAVVSWSERLGIPFATLLKLTGSRVPHVALFTWISKPKKARLLKKVYSRIDRMVLWSSVQRDFALNVLHIPPSKIAFLKLGIDQKFWRPLTTHTDMVCTAGLEMRDFRTLIEALRGLEVHCHIAAGTHRDVIHPTMNGIRQSEPLPPNVTVGRKTFLELRTLYARSRFVVIPLLPTDTDNGITCILEAMAMGKAVICSRTKGQVDVIQEGRTGIYVPQGDPRALRNAIQYLWEHPDEAERMGKEGRKLIEENHTLDQFVLDLKSVVEGVILEHEKSSSSKVRIHRPARLTGEEQ